MNKEDLKHATDLFRAQSKTLQKWYDDVRKRYGPMLPTTTDLTSSTAGGLINIPLPLPLLTLEAATRALMLSSMRFEGNPTPDPTNHS